MAKNSQATQRSAHPTAPKPDPKPGYDQLHAARLAVEAAEARLIEANRAIDKARANAHIDRQPAIDAAADAALTAGEDLADALVAFADLKRKAARSAHAV